MRIAALQYNIANTKNATLDHIGVEAARLAGDEIDLLVLPELCLTGYGTGPAEIASTLDGPDVAALQRVAEDVDATLVAGLCIEEQGVACNRALALASDGIKASYTKRKLFPVWKEPDWFEAGKDNTVIQLGEWRVGVSICYDLRFPELFRESVGVHAFIVVANWPMSRRDHWLTLLKARAIENQAYVIGVNRIGESNNVAFSGDSVGYDYQGRTLFNLEDRSDSGIANLDMEALTRFRKKFPFLP